MCVMALAGQERRRGQLRELYMEDIEHGTQLIHCEGCGGWSSERLNRCSLCR
jgi:hypothetical protein